MTVRAVIVRTVHVPMQWYSATDTQWFCYCVLHAYTYALACMYYTFSVCVFVLYLGSCALLTTCHLRLIKTFPPPSLMTPQGIRPNHSSFFSIVTDKDLRGRIILHFNLFPLLRDCSTVALPMR